MLTYCSQCADAPAFWNLVIDAAPDTNGAWFNGTWQVPWLADCAWELPGSLWYITIGVSTSSIRVTLSSPYLDLFAIYEGQGGNCTTEQSLPFSTGFPDDGSAWPANVFVTPVVSPPCPSPPPAPPPPPSPNPSNSPLPPCLAPPPPPPLGPCLSNYRPPPPPQYRPPFYCDVPPTVIDPKYGEVVLTACPPPLKCYKSDPLPDGSYWMWLGEPRHRSRLTPLAGLLFFATSWEYWIKLAFVSMIDGQGTSVWQGKVGQGRMACQQVTVIQAPWPNPR